MVEMAYHLQQVLPCIPIALDVCRMGLGLDWPVLVRGLTALTDLKLVDCDHLALSATQLFSQLTQLKASAQLAVCCIACVFGCANQLLPQAGLADHA